MLLDRLLDLLEKKQLVLPEDRAYTQNLLLDALHLDAPAEGELIGEDIPDCLAELAEWAVQTDVIRHRILDFFLFLFQIFFTALYPSPLTETISNSLHPSKRLRSRPI